MKVCMLTYKKEVKITVSELIRVVQCPYCGCYFDFRFDPAIAEDRFDICPYCEKEVELDGQ